MATCTDNATNTTLGFSFNQSTSAEFLQVWPKGELH